MDIQVDLDGVCYEWSKTARYMLREYRGYSKDGPLGQESTHWDYIKEHVSKEDWKWLWSDGVRLGVFRYGHCVRGARRGLEALSARGHKLYIATMRPESAVSDTLDWISYYFKDIPLSGVNILREGDSKARLDGDILVDDKVKNVLEWAETGRLALLFSRQWNQEAFGRQSHWEIFRVGDWEHVVDTIKWRYG